MAFFIEGARGSGKTKLAVQEIQHYLKAGKRVATNLDLNLDILCKGTKSIVTRIPDYPRSADLIGLGLAYPELDPDNPDTYDENKFGLLCIDELLASFNSRDWNNSDRNEVVSWLVQSRKYGWRLWLLCQDVDGVDKQIRETLLTEIWHCRSATKFFTSPVMGKVFNFLLIKPILLLTGTTKGFHLCNVYHGKRKDKFHLASTFFYKRYDLHSAYKTSQQFVKDVVLIKDRIVDMRASYSVLPQSYFDVKTNSTAAVQPEKAKSFFSPKIALMTIALCLCIVGYFYQTGSAQVSQTGSAEAGSNKQDSPEPKKNPLRELISNADIEGLYITCSIHRGLFDGDYCFEFDGKPFDPEPLGINITYRGPCHAEIEWSGNIYNVKCSPYYAQSERAVFNDPPPIPESKPAT